MRYKSLAGLFAAASAFMGSCADHEPLDFKVDKPATVALMEELNAYEPLRSYVNREASPRFRLGAGMSMSEYMAKGVMHRLINSNFDEVTLGYEMKHGSVVQADGSLSLNALENLYALAEQQGLGIFGHTLCWHSNQNAAYLNSIISPLVVTSPAFANDVDRSGLVDGSFSGWTQASAGAGIILADNEGMGNGEKAIKLVSSAGSSNGADLRLTSPDIAVVEGHVYEVIFYVKSDKPGEGRVTFEGLANNQPPQDWTGTGVVTETFRTSVGWQRVKFAVSGFTDDHIRMNFDLGYQPDVSYWIDVKNLYVYDTQGEPLINNLIANGDFEAGSPWGGWGNNSTRGFTADGQGFGNTGKALYVQNPSLTGGFWEVQSTYPFPAPLPQGKTYKLSFWVKGSNDGIIRPELQSPDYSSNPFGQVYVTTEWKKVSLETTTSTADRARLIISYGEFAGTVLLDDVVLSEAGAASGGETTIVEKTTAEKEAIIEASLDQWISGMMDASRDHVNAWDVVNEPMDDGSPYALKTGAGRTLPADEFYWQDYLGKDYAVKAFKMARQYGNANDLLFINDYNLEYNLDKCKGLIEYVNYIEAQGAKVDGIGTQMHISNDSDKGKIEEMFKMLAATGKLIKMSELDIGVGAKTNVATDAHYQAQAEMYRFVVEKYFELIPPAQQYGITVWSPRDSAADSFWRAGEPIGLWTEAYNRKRAYAAFSEALTNK